MTVFSMTGLVNPATGLLDPTYEPPSFDFTITGSGFGSKTGLALFDAYDNLSAGSVTGSVGQLTISTSGASTIDASTFHSGSKSLRHDFSSVNFPKMYREFTTRTQTAYCSCWWRFQGSSDAVSVWKLARFNTGDSDPYGDFNRFSAEYTASINSPVPTSLSATTNIDGGVSEYAGTSDVATQVELFTSGQWHFMEWEIDSGTVDGGDLFVEQRVNGVANIRFTGSNFRTTANPELIKYIMSPVNGLDSSGSRAIVYNVDEMYTDASRARVVMTNSATYSSSTNWAIQPVKIWSDTSISCDYNRGSFTIGATAYRHVFNSAGVRVYTSPAITVT